MVDTNEIYNNQVKPNVCQALLTYLPNLAEHYKDENVVIAKVNSAYNSPKLSNKFMVRSVPLTVPCGAKRLTALL